MYRIRLSAEQQEELRQRTRARGLAPSTRERLEMVRLSDAGWSCPRIARYLGQHEQTVRAWIKAFGVGGFSALSNKPRGGKQSALTPAMLEALRTEIAHGPRAGHLETTTWAALPKSRAKRRCPTLDEQAAAHGLRAEEVGPIDAQRFIAFVWHIAGRPPTARADWRRERPLWIVLDNYSV